MLLRFCLCSRSLPLLLRRSLALLLRSSLALLLGLLDGRSTADSILAGSIPARLSLVLLILNRLIAGGLSYIHWLSGMGVRFNRIVLLRLRLIVSLQSRGSAYGAIGRKRLADNQTGGAPLVAMRKLRPVGAGYTLILHLGVHGCGVCLAASRQLCRSGTGLQSTRSAIETHAGASAVVLNDAAVVDVMHDGDVHIVDGAVVIKMSAAPIASLVTDSDVAKAVVDAAIEADVGAPVATIKAVAVMPVAPISRRPERALVGSLHLSRDRSERFCSVGDLCNRG